MSISPIKSGSLPYDNRSNMPALQNSLKEAAAAESKPSAPAAPASGSGAPSATDQSATPPPAQIASAGKADTTFANAGSVTVTDAAGKSKTFDVKAGESVADLNKEINKSGLNVTASVNSSGQFQLTSKTGRSTSGASTVKLSSDSGAVLSQLGGFKSSTSNHATQTASATSVSASSSAASTTPTATAPETPPHTPQVPTQPTPGGTMFAAEAMSQASETLLGLFK